MAKLRTKQPKTTHTKGAKPKPKAAPDAKRKASPKKTKDVMPRESKQERLIAMLRAPGGTTIAQIAKTFGWQPHTVRGIFSGALKKRLGLAVTSTKAEGGERVYRIS